VLASALSSREGGKSLNEMLRRALFRARMSEEDVAAHLGVDPKTVRRWLEGRVPYPRHRQALSRLVEADESDLWPGAQVIQFARSWHEEVKAVYPHRWAVPREIWHQLFRSAEHEIGVLTYSGLSLVRDLGLLDVFASQARAGVRIRIALGDPDNPLLVGSCGPDGCTEGAAFRIREALNFYLPLLAAGNVEIRLHQARLYSSLYRADSDVLVNHRAYGIAAENTPLIHLGRAGDGGMFAAYISSFNNIWSVAKPIAS
jgi:transcriptional regulator with XRE-family HTH domain